MKEYITNFKMTTINEMADGDVQRLLEIFIDEKEYVTNHSNHQHIKDKGMAHIGFGCYGDVYEFIGSDGYEYAVKITSFTRDEDKDIEFSNDGRILSKLQGIVGYPKLFFYIEGEYVLLDKLGKIRNNNDRFMIMVSQKIKGFTVNKITGWNVNEKNLGVFLDKLKPEILETFDNSIWSTFERGIQPNDTHSENVMFDEMEGIFYIVDVGRYCKKKFNINEYDLSGFRNYSAISSLSDSIKSKSKKEVLA